MRLYNNKALTRGRNQGDKDGHNNNDNLSNNHMPDFWAVGFDMNKHYLVTGTRIYKKDHSITLPFSMMVGVPWYATNKPMRVHKAATAVNECESEDSYYVITSMVHIK